MNTKKKLKKMCYHCKHATKGYRCHVWTVPHCHCQHPSIPESEYGWDTLMTIFESCDLFEKKEIKTAKTSCNKAMHIIRKYRTTCIAQTLYKIQFTPRQQLALQARKEKMGDNRINVEISLAGSDGKIRKIDWWLNWYPNMPSRIFRGVVSLAEESGLPVEEEYTRQA